MVLLGSAVGMNGLWACEDFVCLHRNSSTRDRGSVGLTQAQWGKSSEAEPHALRVQERSPQQHLCAMTRIGGWRQK